MSSTSGNPDRLKTLNEAKQTHFRYIQLGKIAAFRLLISIKFPQLRLLNTETVQILLKSWMLVLSRICEWLCFIHE